jgi:hypothetical protein
MTGGLRVGAGFASMGLAVIPMLITVNPNPIPNSVVFMSDNPLCLNNHSSWLIANLTEEIRRIMQISQKIMRL